MSIEAGFFLKMAIIRVGDLADYIPQLKEALAEWKKHIDPLGIPALTVRGQILESLIPVLELLVAGSELETPAAVPQLTDEQRILLQTYFNA